MQLCPFMVAADLMTLLWQEDTPTPQYPQLTEEEMPSIQQAFFGTLQCLQESDPHLLELLWTPSGSSPTRTSKTTPQHNHATS